MKEPECVVDILDALDELADKGEKVAIADVVEKFGGRSYGPFLLIPALLELSPVGAIPGIPTFLAITVGIVAFQMLIGKGHLWLPGFIENRSVSSEKMKKATKKLQGIAKFLDKHFHGRMKHFTGRWYRRIAALIIIALALTIPPLEVIPFASSGPMLAIACFGLAIMVRDGLLMLIATGLSVAAFGLGFGLWSGGEGSEGG